MFPILHVGPLSINASILILLTGLWTALWVGKKQSPTISRSFSLYENLVLTALLAGIIGARLGYAVQNISAFMSDPLALITPSPKMLDLPAGILAASLAALVYSHHHSMKLWKTLDHLTPSAAVFASAVHLADLASGNAYGAPTRVPWCINLWNECRHPTQVYAFILATGILFLTLYTSRYDLPEGFQFWFFIGLSALARLLVEPFRGDSVILVGIFRQAQIIAWLVLLISLFQISQRIKLIAKE
ncbi:MAG: prolipoprotein diacylglyceryl transferase [Thermanaerothrix sp.]|nr:prolipoprotein diacylglyceryl transferase [Thermanaerothrix sp.]